MIKLEELKSSDIGRKVNYINGIGEKEMGIIKSWNDKYIFVVYRCDNDWKNYKDYTAAATCPSNLEWLF